MIFPETLSLIKELELKAGDDAFNQTLSKVIGLLFQEIHILREEIQDTKNFMVLAIKWDPKVANQMLTRILQDLKNQGKVDGTYVFQNEINDLKKAMLSDTATSDYESFCKFFVSTLGYHPFLREK